MLETWKNQLVLFNVLGDAEAFVFDWAALSEAQQKAFVAKHLAAFAKNLEKKKRALSDFTPMALMGTSMPDDVMRAVDLSAPHEGTLLLSNKKGSVFYVTAADDPCLHFVWDTPDQMNPRSVGSDETFDPASLSFDGAPTESTGFSLGEWKMATGGLPMVIGKKSGLLGIIERIRASS